MGNKEGAFFFDIKPEDTAAFIKLPPPSITNALSSFQPRKVRALLWLDEEKRGILDQKKSLSINNLRNINFLKWR
jgi:hypothetical protein